VRQPSHRVQKEVEGFWYWQNDVTIKYSFFNDL